MWQETDIQKAVKAAAKGKEVRVAVPDGAGVHIHQPVSGSGAAGAAKGSD